MGRSKTPKNQFFESEEGKKLFQDFINKQKEKNGDKAEKVSSKENVQTGKTTVATGLPEGDLPGTGKGFSGDKTTNDGKGDSGKNDGQKQEVKFTPEQSAQSLSAFVSMFANLLLWKQGRELVNEQEMKAYANEITPFVTKYQHLLKYIVEIQAIGATGLYVWAIAQKPVINPEKY